MQKSGKWAVAGASQDKIDLAVRYCNSHLGIIFTSDILCKVSDREIE